MQTVTVIADQRHVAIDGHTLSVEMPSGVWMNLRAMRWDPSVANWPGWIEYRDGSGHGFKDHERVVPFIEAWQRAKVKDDERKAIAKAHAEAAERERNEHEAKQAAQRQEAQEAMRPYHEALDGLAETHDQIIQAVEESLLAEGRIDADLVAKRQAWRETVKAERAKAG